MAIADSAPSEAWLQLSQPSLPSRGVSSSMHNGTPKAQDSHRDLHAHTQIRRGGPGESLLALW